MHLFGIHIFKNLFRYAWWSLEAITPFRVLASDTVRWMLWGGTAVVGLLYYYQRKSHSPGIFPARWIGFLAGWAVIGVMPALFLPNHYYKYYLTYSLPPIVLLWVSTLYWICTLLTGRVNNGAPSTTSPSPVQLPLSWTETDPCYQRNPYALTAIFAALSLINVASAAQYFRARDHAGISDRYVVGTNHLIHRGHAARLILDYLHNHHSTVPEGSVFLIDGCDLESLGNDAGLQVFYGDPSVRVFRLSDVIRDRRNASAAKDGIQRDADKFPRRSPGPEPRNLFCLRIRDGKVLEEDPVKAIDGE